MLYHVKAGIIGLEELGMHYASLINDHVKNLNLIAGTGRTQKELLYAKNDLSLQYVYNDEKSLCSNHDIDAVVILSDTRFKADYAIQAIEAGKHVFLLNPLALNLEDAQQVVKVAASHPSQIVQCASTTRINQMLVKLKEIISSKKYGAIKWMDADSSFVRSLQKSMFIPSGSKYLDGLLEEIDLALWLSDLEWKSVKVMDNKPYKICQAFSNSDLIYQFVIKTDSKNLYGSVKIYCEKAVLQIENQRPNQISIFTEEGEVIVNCSNVMNGFSFLEYMQLHHFTRCVLGKEKNLSKLNNTIQVMEMALAFEKADVLNTEVFR